MYAWTDYVQGVWLWPDATLDYLCITGVVLPWRVRTLHWLRGCVVSVCAPTGTTVTLVLRVLSEPTVVPVRRAIASGYICDQRVLAEPKVVCVRRKSNPRYDLGIYFCCVLWLGCHVRGPGCAILGCAPTGSMVVLAMRVFAEPMLVPVRRAIASGCTCARRVLAEHRVVCV